LIECMNRLASDITILSLPKFYVLVPDILIYSWTCCLLYTKISWVLWFKWVLRIMNELTFNRYILIFYILVLHRNILNIFFRNHLGNIASDMFHSIVISGNNFSWNNINSDKIPIVNNFFFLGNETVPGLIDIVDNFFFHRHILYSAITFNHISTNSWFCFNGAFRFSLSLSDNWRTSLSDSWVWVLVSIGLWICMIYLWLIINRSVVIWWIW
jgi:hypothetical protein